MTTVPTLARQDRVMVLAVHPDDETLGAGGLLQQAVAAGAAVRVVFVTNGDNNPWPQRLLERRWRLAEADRQRWGRRRRGEALAALQVLGIGKEQAVFLDLPDQGLTRLLRRNDASAVIRLSEEVSAWRPSLLVIPAMQDLHPDHNAVAVLAEMALMRLPPAMPRPQLLAYLVHGREVLDAPAQAVSLTMQQVENKRQAILRHTTQVAFSRRRFLQYAQPREEWLRPAAEAAAFQPRHPVLGAVTDGDELHIHLRLGRWLSRFGQPRLYLIAACPRHSLSASMAIGAGDAAIIDCDGGELGRARVDVDDGEMDVMMPAKLFEGCQRLYLKLERRWGFFDLAGWRPAPFTPLALQKAATIGLIPCYNVADFCEQVIRQAVHFVDRLIVIDDGSGDTTPEILARLAAEMPERIRVITFAQNQGKGVGLMAGFCEALNHYDFQVLVTLDGDGQHPPQEIPSLVEAVESGADMAIGGRELACMPTRSKLGNTVVSSLLRWLYPHAPADTQSGLRAFSREFAGEIVGKVRGSRYETEIQVLLLALSQQRLIVSVPIPTIYIDNNRSSKFRPVADSIRILYALLGWELNHSHWLKP